MAKLDKKFKYRGYKFNTSVCLYEKIERKPNGKVFHLVITQSLDPIRKLDFYCEKLVETPQLQETIENHKKEAIEYVDSIKNKYLSPEQILLVNLGFS
jgi:hypothetical protein